MIVIEKNSWEHRTYYLGDEELTPVVKAVRLVFPDGYTVVANLEWRYETHRYSDHGHESSADSIVPYVNVDVHGVMLTNKLSNFPAEVELI